MRDLQSVNEEKAIGVNPKPGEEEQRES